MSYQHIIREEDTTPARPVDLKYENRYNVLQAFRYGCECTVAEVAQLTGISKLTVKRAIQFFCDNGILRSAGLGQSTDVGGKKPENFVLNDSRHTLSISLWPDHLQIALFTLAGQLVCQTNGPISLTSSPEEIFAFVGEKALALLARQDITCKDLYGVALSSSGTVDYRTGYLRYNSHAPHWGMDIPVSDYLRRIFGEDVVVKVENAGKSAGLAVLLDEPQLRGELVLTLFTSWGISGSLIQNGELLSGKDSLVGEIGHMIVDPCDVELCGCGLRGCFERQVSIERVRRIIRQTPPTASSPLCGLSPEDITFEAIFTASEAGDSYARDMTSSLAEIFARALHNISLVCSPSHVIIQGNYGHADAYFDHCLTDALSKFHYYPLTGAFNIRYDNRDLFSLDAQGCWFLLNENYFLTPSLYID